MPQFHDRQEQGGVSMAPGGKVWPELGLGYVMISLLSDKSVILAENKSICFCNFVRSNYLWWKKYRINLYHWPSGL